MNEHAQYAKDIADEESRGETTTAHKVLEKYGKLWFDLRKLKCPLPVVIIEPEHEQCVKNIMDEASRGETQTARKALKKYGKAWFELRGLKCPIVTSLQPEKIFHVPRNTSCISCNWATHISMEYMCSTCRGILCKRCFKRYAGCHKLTDGGWCPTQPKLECSKCDRLFLDIQMLDKCEGSWSITSGECNKLICKKCSSKTSKRCTEHHIETHCGECSELIEGENNLCYECDMRGHEPDYPLVYLCKDCGYHCQTENCKDVQPICSDCQDPGDPDSDKSIPFPSCRKCGFRVCEECSWDPTIFHASNKRHGLCAKCYEKKSAKRQRKK